MIVRELACRAGLMTTLLAISLLAHAQMPLASIEASVVVVPRCRVEIDGDVTFGSLDPGHARDATATTSVRVACTRGASYRMVIDTGQGFDASRSLRTMRRGTGERLPYALVVSEARSLAQGWTRPADVRLEASVSGRDYENLPAGTYEDVVRIAIEY